MLKLTVVKQIYLYQVIMFYNFIIWFEESFFIFSYYSFQFSKVVE